MAATAAVADRRDAGELALDGGEIQEVRSGRIEGQG